MSDYVDAGCMSQHMRSAGLEKKKWFQLERPGHSAFRNCGYLGFFYLLTELFINAFKHPIKLLCIGLLATRISSERKISNRADSPFNSTKRKTKLWADVRNAVFNASRNAVCDSILKPYSWHGDSSGLASNCCTEDNLLFIISFLLARSDKNRIAMYVVHAEHVITYLHLLHLLIVRCSDPELVVPVILLRHRYCQSDFCANNIFAISSVVANWALPLYLVLSNPVPRPIRQTLRPVRQWMELVALAWVFEAWTHLRQHKFLAVRHPTRIGANEVNTKERNTLNMWMLKWR